MNEWKNFPLKSFLINRMSTKVPVLCVSCSLFMEQHIIQHNYLRSSLGAGVEDEKIFSFVITLWRIQLWKWILSELFTLFFPCLIRFFRFWIFFPAGRACTLLGARTRCHFTPLSRRYFHFTATTNAKRPYRSATAAKPADTHSPDKVGRTLKLH